MNNKKEREKILAHDKEYLGMLEGDLKRLPAVILRFKQSIAEREGRFYAD